MQATNKRSVSMKPGVTGRTQDVQIDIQKQRVVLLFPNQPAVNFSLEVSDLRCAGQSPTYTYKAWVWCAYINALHTVGIRLGYERNQRLFRKIWRRIQNSTKR